MIFKKFSEKVKNECIESVRKEVLFQRIGKRKWYESKYDDTIFRRVGEENDLIKYTGYKPVKYFLVYRTVSGREFTSEYTCFEEMQDAFNNFD